MKVLDGISRDRDGIGVWTEGLDSVLMDCESRGRRYFVRKRTMKPTAGQGEWI